MTFKRTIISDSPSEDKGYDRNHRQTNGGQQAYARGEMPLSYWSKGILMKRLTATLKKMKRDEKYWHRYQKFISNMNMSEQDIMLQIGKSNTKKLINTLLEFKGVHYTGNFFQYTKFYGLVEPARLLYRIRGNLVKPREVIQLKLDITGV